MVLLNNNKKDNMDNYLNGIIKEIKEHKNKSKGDIEKRTFK